MKILASDFDETLYFGTFKNKDLKAIKEFQKDGHMFGVCTGRGLHGVLNPSQGYDINYDFYILLSGALILDKNHRVIYERKLPLSLVEDIFQFSSKVDASVVYQDETYRVYKNKNIEMRGTHLQSFLELQTEFVSSLSFHFAKGENDKARDLAYRINQKYGDVVEAFANNHNIDLAAKGCSKGAGIKILQDYLHVLDRDVYCIGDSWNDLTMLKSVDNSYTFDYSPHDVRESAKYIVSHLDECIQDVLNR